MIKDKIKSSLIANMKNGSKLTVSTIRMISAKIKEKEIELGLLKEGKELNNNDILQVLEQMLKQRKQSYEEYIKANRQDLAEKEANEINIIKNFMPPKMSASELEEIINQVIKNMKASTVRDLGKVISCIKEKYPGRIDVSTTIDIIKAKLSG